MSLENFYTTTFTAKRMTWSGESGAETSIADFKGHIQQANPQFVEQIGEAWGKTFIIWCAVGTNIESGDSLDVTTGNYEGTYNVKNVQIHAVGQNVPHLEITCVKDIE